MPIVYEVDLEVDRAISEEFDAWLVEHAAAMCALPGFEDATLWQVDDDGGPRVRRVARYVLRDRAALDAYLATHAPRMRADGIARFGDSAFTAVRRVLAPFGG
jgi:hypothetical protein